MRWLRLLLCVVALSFGTGCTHVCYLIQAAAGQDELSYKARPIEQAVADRSLPAPTRRALSLVAPAKRFGEAHGLKPTDNYREFVQLDRDAAVWVVTAAEELRFEQVRWTFPIAGSVPYLGYFNRIDADQHARSLADEGYDVDVRRAGAYSTLGWLSDPVLSTMLGDGPGARAGLIETVLHESVHATLYVPDQSYFNESLADFVAVKLTRAFLVGELGDPAEAAAWEAQNARSEQRVKRLHEAYKELDALYKSPLSDALKRRRKRAILEALRAELGIARQLSNATLAQSRTYHAGEPGFGVLFTRCGADWKRFWGALRTLTPAAFGKAQVEELDPVLRGLCR